MIQVSSNFDSGNIILVSAEEAGNIRLQIRKDTNSEFLQWFHFRLSGVHSMHCKMIIENAGQTTYPLGWENYNACASYDRVNWFRVPSTYIDGGLVIEHTPEKDSIYYAYFTPYSFERLQDFMQRTLHNNFVRLSTLGKTVQERPIDLLTIGDEGHSIKIWIIGRQHPGEPMASWFIEGLVNRLVDTADPVSRKLLQEAVFYIVPNMNVDGSILGNLRANAAGANLNREWANPDLERSPEVYHVKKTMQEKGLSLCLDVHGDESIPYNFVAGAEGNPGYNDRIARLESQFKQLWEEHSPDFQTSYGYDADAPGTANMNVCTNQLSQLFNALVLTIEMPFKDHDALPDEKLGWSSPRSMHLGAGVLQVIHQILPHMD